MISPIASTQRAPKPAARRLAPLALAAFGLLLAACSSSSPSSSSSSTSSTQAASDPYAAADLTAPANALTGAGSTFDQPFFTKAFYEYNLKNSGVTVNYASIGSGGGIQQFQANTVNFGATDVPMSPLDISKATGGQTLQVPVALGGVSISYNVPGVNGGLKLTPKVLSEIYLGTVKTWDDSQIKA